MSDSPHLLIGIDMGKTTVSFATGELAEDGACENIRTTNERHFGRPLELFIKYYRELDHRNILGIAATGIYGNRLIKPVVTGVPEEIAQEYATLKLHSTAGPVNIIRLGGRGYSILTRDESRAGARFNFEENDKCSAGTGETIEKICGRMGLTFEQAIGLAENASESIPITARCSVFAKTEMTHFANQGEPHEKLLLGYFESVAENVFSLYDKCKVDGPVILVGNGALIGPVSAAFGKMASVHVEVSGYAGVYEAVGALCYAAGRSWDDKFKWPADPQSLIKAKKKRIQSLKPTADMKGSVIHLEDNTPDVAPNSPAFLGIDLGSTGSKAALIDVSTGALIADVYRRTDGNPVEAGKELVAQLDTRGAVIAIGLTGSGRDAAATIFRAAYPDLISKIFVQNEIVAHACAAIRYDPDRGRSLSIVEIGGQDAKFINIQGGRIIESDMNRACSAGTGSFLEEQANFYGLHDITRYGEVAAGAANPPDLGQMCTVFVADLAAEALNEGYTVEDIFAGFQYSVIINYKNRVMGNRRFMDRIFFQGKPATNPSLAGTLAAVTGREVYVPPNPGAMGAIGIAMLAGESIEELDDSRPFDLKKIIGARIISRRTFRCNDPKYRNLCRIETATVTVWGEQRKVVSGGSCPKYEAVSTGSRKLPKHVPNPYRERKELLDNIPDRSNTVKSGPTVCIPYGHYLIDYLPFFHAFFSKLGANVEIARSGPDTLPLGNRRVSANNTCTPTKIMHGLAKTDVDYMFMPKFVEIPRLVKKSGAGTCPMTQASPEMVELALEAEGAKVDVIRPIFHLGNRGFKSPKFIFELRKTWKAFAGDPGIRARSLIDFVDAYLEALRVQHNFEEGLFDIGRRSLEFAREEGYPVVLIAGNSHVIHEPIMNAGIHELITSNGAIALPLDCFPIPDSIPPLERVYWGTSNRLLRASLAAARFSRGFVFPLLIVSYGCGPSSFVERLFNDLFENYPHTVLESDGHGGRAGYITRIQAFLYSARSYEKGEVDAVPPEKIARYDRFPMHGPEKLRNSKIIEFSVGPNGGKHGAAIKRSGGYDADYAIPAEPVGFHMGREMCSGKECLPYQLIWGSFCKYLDDHPPSDDKKTLLHNVTGFGPCRNGMFPLADEIALDKMGLAEKVEIVTSGSFKASPALAAGKWFSIVGTDLLNQMRLYCRPVEKNHGTADRLFVEYSDRIAEILERPIKDSAFKTIIRNLRLIEDLLTEGAMDFYAIQTKSEAADEIRTVYLCGDIFLRVDEWGSDDLARKLNDLGLRVVLEPYGEIAELLLLYRMKDLVEMESRLLQNRLMRIAMEFATERLVAKVNKVHPWIRWDGIREIDRESRQLTDGTPFTEAIATIGGALLAWRTRPIDGIVVVGPWGCGPTLITEAQLRRKTEIPLIFVYNDGEPIDETRLAGFAWRLKSRPSRQLSSE